MSERNYRPRIRLKSPRDAFPKCPACLSSRVAPMGEEEVYCKDCDWDSLAIHAQLMAEAGLWPKIPASVLREKARQLRHGMPSTILDEMLIDSASNY